MLRAKLEREDAIHAAMSDLGEKSSKEVAQLLINSERWDSDANGRFWECQANQEKAKFADFAGRIYGEQSYVATQTYDVRVQTWLKILKGDEAK